MTIFWRQHTTAREDAQRLDRDTLTWLADEIRGEASARNVVGVEGETSETIDGILQVLDLLDELARHAPGEVAA